MVEVIVDVSGRPLRVGQQVTISCPAISSQWPGIVRGMLLYDGKRTTIERFVSNRVVQKPSTALLACDVGEYAWLPSWLTACDVGLKGLINRYKQEAAHGR